MTTFSDFWRENFNGDGASLGDLFWFTDSGFNAVWLMNGAGSPLPGGQANLPFTGPTWHVESITDFNNAGPPFSDILWQNDNGAVALWQMAGTAILSQQNLPNPGSGWHAKFADDFNNPVSTSADILFQHDLGFLAIWTFDGGAGPPTITGQFNVTQNPGPTWHAVATGDTVGPGLFDRAGIVFQNDNGLIAIWTTPAFLNNGTVEFLHQANLQNVGPTWHVKGMGDFDGDGLADIVFQNDNGLLAIWQMGGLNGTQILSQFNIAQNPGASWHVVGVRDMNSDGRADIVFQNDNGANAIWAGLNAAHVFTVQENINPNPNSSGHLDWHLV
jgi:serralysin